MSFSGDTLQYGCDLIEQAPVEVHVHHDIVHHLKNINSSIALKIFIQK